jgi:deazaflavin-dependent oxidoreductase (nitroreductase family)
MPPEDPQSLADEDFCYLTTVGRVTGKPHELEIWFALQGQTLYMLSGGRDRSDWVKNLRRTPEVIVSIGEGRFEGRARVVEDEQEEEDALARRLLVEKYERTPGRLGNWRRNALPIAVDLCMRNAVDDFASSAGSRIENRESRVVEGSDAESG